MFLLCLSSFKARSHGAAEAAFFNGFFCRNGAKVFTLCGSGSGNIFLPRQLDYIVTNGVIHTVQQRQWQKTVFATAAAAQNWVGTYLLAALLPQLLPLPYSVNNYICYNVILLLREKTLPLPHRVNGPLAMA